MRCVHHAMGIAELPVEPFRHFQGAGVIAPSNRGDVGSRLAHPLDLSMRLHRWDDKRCRFQRRAAFEGPAFMEPPPLKLSYFFFHNT